MSILVVTPVMKDPSGKARLYARSLASLYNLKWDHGLDFYQAVGGDDYHRPSETVTRKYQEAREVFLAGKWDYLFCAESDMILPPDTLTKLMAFDCDITYGLYALRHNQNKWSAATYLEGTKWRSLSEEPDNARAAWGNAVQVVGVGQGCTLIKRDVLEAIEFRYIPGVSSDWGLSLDAQASGLKQIADLSIICGHQTITPSPMTLWPDINEPNLIRVEYPA